MEELDLFESFIIKALSNVEDSYFRTTYQDIENFSGALRNRRGRLIDNNFERYGERVFCYEFYHQMRILIDNERAENPNFLGESKLQAEVEKMQIIELAQRLGLQQLNSEYAPDFLMHTPGNANLHPFVIEVKCEPNISWEKVFNDLNKLDQFVTQYNYQRGIFLSIHTQDEYIGNILDMHYREIETLNGRNRIKVINKSNEFSNPIIWQL